MALILPRPGGGCSSGGAKRRGASPGRTTRIGCRDTRVATLVGARNRSAREIKHR